MSTYTNIYGYLNASLHYAYYKKTAVETKKDLRLLGYFFESNPEEMAYKGSCQETEFKAR